MTRVVMIDLTLEQKKVIDWIANGKGNALVSSVAGSGKSTLITQCVNEIPVTQKAIVLSFNRKIADEMGAKLRERAPKRFPGHQFDWRYTQASTLNSAGFRLISNHFKYIEKSSESIQVDQGKCEKLFQDLSEQLYVLEMKAYKEYSQARNRAFNIFDNEEELQPPTRRSCYSAFNDLVRLTRSSLYNPERSSRDYLCRVINFFGIKVAFIDWAVEALSQVDKYSKELFATQNQISLDEQVYLPWRLDLRDPFPWDWILIDECQDLSPVRMDLLRRMSHRSTRFVFVGDNDQSIYGWTGADPKSFARIRRDFSPNHFELTSTFRCSHQVTRLAQAYAPKITAFPSNLEGKVIRHVIGSQLPELNEGDAILSRLKSALIRIAIKFIENGRQFKGFEDLLDERIFSYIQEIFDVSTDASLPLQERLCQLSSIIDASIDAEGCTIQKLEAQDLANALNILSESLPNLNDFDGLKKQLLNVSKGSNNGPLLSTIHKQKGAEFNNVLIVDFSHLPLVWRDQNQWQYEQENNLIYVAVTRAKNTLHLFDITPKGIVSSTILKASEISEFVKKKSLDIRNKLDDAVSSDLKQNSAKPNQATLYMQDESMNRFVDGHEFQFGARLYIVLSRINDIIICINKTSGKTKTFRMASKDVQQSRDLDETICCIEDFIASCPDPENLPVGLFMDASSNDLDLLHSEWLRIRTFWSSRSSESLVAQDIVNVINKMYSQSRSLISMRNV
ncbi:ATP-dependent helicase [Synechococcus sp. AH-736-M02]|nr:ATP-dependent helicase [Synechococcus sp. AH-736-M02]